MTTIADACTDYGLQRVPAAVLVRLLQSRGRYVETQGLRDAIEAATGDRASDGAVSTAVKRIRKSPSAPLIECRAGVGYRAVDGR